MMRGIFECDGKTKSPNERILRKFSFDSISIHLVFYFYKDRFIKVTSQHGKSGKKEKKETCSTLRTQTQSECIVHWHNQFGGCAGKEKMKYLLFTLLLVFLSVFYSSGQYAKDSTAIIKTYEKKIRTGLVIKRTGGIILIVAPITAIVSGLIALSSDSNTANDIGMTALAVGYYAIPITLIGKYIEKHNRKKLKEYRMTLGSTGYIPTIGVQLKF